MSGVEGDGVDKDLLARSESSPDEVVSLYDEWATAEYDADVEGWGYDAPRQIASLVAAHLSERKPGDAEVLDAGCGTGLVGAALHAVGISGIIGGDVSEASLDSARRRDVYDRVLPLDLNAPLPFADELFAAAVSVGVFTYLTDSEATVRELLRVVAPGGWLIFTQRTDLWSGRDFDGLLASLDSEGVCSVEVSEPTAYLPGHPEFGEDIGIVVATLTKLG
jgi:predicted TPR repeat methyltransferase